MPAALFLLSDFGLRDAYVGVMRAVVAGLAPDVPVHDLLHEVPPQDVLGARLQLAAALPYLPDGAVVVAVVDPGVGSDRAAVVVASRDARGREVRFVAPDNGLLTSLLQPERPPYASPLEARAAWRLDPESVGSRGPGTTFDGRDLFAPAGARLARGEPPERFARPVALDELRCTPAPPLLERSGTTRGRIAWIDRFGDLVSDVPPPQGRFRVLLGDRTIDGPAAGFADVAVGEAVAYVGSLGTVEVALRERSAAEALGIAVGAPIEVRAPAAGS